MNRQREPVISNRLCFLGVSAGFSTEQRSTLWQRLLSGINGWWTLVLLTALALGSNALGETNFYYCYAEDTHNSTMYYSDVFATDGPPGEIKGRLSLAFHNYVAANYEVSVLEAGICWYKPGKGEARSDRDSHQTTDKQIHHRIIQTGWPP